MKSLIFTLAVTLILLAACKDKPQLENVKAPPGAVPPSTATAPAASTQTLADLADLELLPKHYDAIFDYGPEGLMWEKFPDGLCIQELKRGIGREPDYGQTVWVSLVAKLPDGRTEVARFTKDKPLHFRVGSKKVIRGLSLGVLKMRLDGQRRIYIPPALAWGPAGSPDKKVPPDSAVLYDVQLLQITGDPVAVPKEAAETQMGPNIPDSLMGPSSPPASAPATGHTHP